MTQDLDPRKSQPDTEQPVPRYLVRLLNKVDKDPDAALEDPRCLKPHFLTRYFDLCDGKALEAPWMATDYALVAVELAKRTGDRHLINRAAGVAAHAFIGGEKWQLAAEALDGYGHRALECCQHCAADWLMRYGDLLTEVASPRRARAFLEDSAEVLGGELDDDVRGRILFLRGIIHHDLGDCDLAVDDAGAALQLLSLATPHGYFLDAIAFLACFVEYNDDRRHDASALGHLVRFRKRLKGLKAWNAVRDRVRWVEGQLHARLGHPRRARKRLESARKGHVKRAPHPWALAVAVDEALIYCLAKKRPELHEHSLRRIFRACTADLKLEPELSERLAKLFELIKEQPYHAKKWLSQFRRSFIAPVPGLLVNLKALGAKKRRWPHKETPRPKPFTGLVSRDLCS